MSGDVRLLLTDHYNSYNRGDGAILDGMLVALREALPGATFMLSSNYPEVAEAAHGIPALEWGVMRFGSRVALAGWAGRSLAWTVCARLGWSPDVLLHGWERALMHAYREADVVICCGGSYLRRGYAGSRWRLWQMLLAKWLGRPVMLYAQTIGPFDAGTSLARWAGFVLRRLDVITLRDSESRQVLDQLGVRGPYVEVTADAALALEPPPIEPPPPVPRDEEGPSIGVSVIHWHKFRQGGEAGYFQAVAETLDGLIEDWGARVEFLSTTVAPPGSAMDVSGTGQDDVTAAKCVVAAMEHRDRATIQDEPLSVRDLHARIAAHHLWIGTRLHSTILATTALVPTVAVAYEPKTRGYFELLGLPDFVLDIEGITAGDLRALAERARRDSAAIRATLAERRPELAARARRSATLAAALAAGRLSRRTAPPAAVAL